MKKILLSLSSIAAVAAIVAVGSTGAWWTDTAESSENTFHSGSMNLQLANEPGQPYSDDWHDDFVKSTWDYEDMTPGGDEYGNVLRLKNNGSTPADWLKFDSEVVSSNADKSGETPMSHVMKMTKFAYAGTGLLNGAGGDIDYEWNSDNCDVTDTLDNLANSDGLLLNNRVNSGDTVCVESGTYTGSLVIQEDKDDVTVVSLEGPEETTIDANGNQWAVTINADGVEVKGFTIESYKYGGIRVDGAEGVTISENIIDGEENDGSSGDSVYTENGAEVMVKNNKLVNNVYNGDKNIGTDDWSVAAGVSVHDGDTVTVKGNQIDGNDVGVHIQYEESETAVNAHRNNIVNNNYGAGVEDTTDGSGNVGDDVDLDATYNYWNGNDNRSEGEVDDAGETDNSFVGFINDQNDNGYADLADLHYEDVIVDQPKLEEGVQKLDLAVQLDGPDAENYHQGEKVDLDMEITMGQGPANQ